MKHIILTLIMLFTFTISNAERRYYRAEYFSYKVADDSGNWSSWSKWEKSNVCISIDLDKEVIEVYTEQEQKYIVLNQGEEYEDVAEGSQVEFSVVDQDGDFGIVRFRVQRNGTIQLYVEFDNIMWVYSGLNEL